MTEEQKMDTGTPSEQERKESPVFQEFQTMGQELATAFKALWDHEDSRRLRNELQEGFADLGRQIDSAIHSAQESEAAQQFGAQIKETVERARTSDVASKMEEGLLTGLRELNSQIARFVSSVESSEATGGEAGEEPEAEAEA